jgi:hypothetical protein
MVGLPEAERAPARTLRLAAHYSGFARRQWNSLGGSGKFFA